VLLFNILFVIYGIVMISHRKKIELFVMTFCDVVQHLVLCYGVTMSLQKNGTSNMLCPLGVSRKGVKYHMCRIGT